MLLNLIKLILIFSALAAFVFGNKSTKELGFVSVLFMVSFAFLSRGLNALRTRKISANKSETVWFSRDVQTTHYWLECIFTFVAGIVLFYFGIIQLTHYFFL